MRVLPGLVLVLALVASSARAQVDAGQLPATPTDAQAAAIDAVSNGLSGAAAALGVSVAPEVVGAYATFLVDGLTQRKLKDALAAGDGAAALIATQDDAERIWLDAPTTERPGASVKLKQGDAAPWQGQLLAPDEDVRRTRGYVGAAVTLKTENTDGVVLPRPVFWTVLGVASAMLAGGIASGLCAESNCLHKPGPK